MPKNINDLFEKLNLLEVWIRNENIITIVGELKSSIDKLELWTKKFQSLQLDWFPGAETCQSKLEILSKNLCIDWGMGQQSFAQIRQYTLREMNTIRKFNLLWNQYHWLTAADVKSLLPFGLQLCELSFVKLMKIEWENEND